MVMKMGATPISLAGVDRSLYHVAAVFASNYAVAIMAAAEKAWTAAGLSARTARPALSPLLTAVAANIARMDLTDALTGPVARGDAETVERHLLALMADPALLDLYRRLADELLAVAPGSADAIRPLIW
jgi:predicted short-subunit dehydrogenase-like oxidoreductase (DUF2520 family)